MASVKSRLSRYQICNTCEQVMPVPVIPVIGLSMNAPTPISNLPVPFPQPGYTPTIPFADIKILNYPTEIAHPVGTILANGIPFTPPNYLLCNGGEYSRTQYLKLFEVIGVYYGLGNGTTTFNVPHLMNNYDPSVTYIIKYAD